MNTEFAESTSEVQSADGPSGTWHELYQKIFDLPDLKRPKPHDVEAGPAGHIDQWVEQVGPRNLIERDLTTRAAHLSWSLEQARKAEAAILARQVERAAERRAERVELLGRRLLGDVGRSTSRAGAKSASADVPAIAIRRLESTAEGCRWLIDRWSEVASLHASGATFDIAEIIRLIRLLGKEPLDARHDAELNAILTAFDAASPGLAERLIETCLVRVPANDPDLRDQRSWRELPGSWNRVKAGLDLFLVELTAVRVGRLAALIERHEAAPSAQCSDAADLAAGNELRRLRTLQTTLSRELRQIVEQLRKLKTAAEWTVPAAEQPLPAEQARPEQAAEADRPASASRTATQPRLRSRPRTDRVSVRGERRRGRLGGRLKIVRVIESSVRREPAKNDAKHEAWRIAC